MAEEAADGGGGRTHYEVLELERDAILADVKRAYRRLAVRHHPDRNVGDEEGATARFREINEAYEVLSNVDSRGDYDRSLERGGGGNDGRSRHSGGWSSGRGRHGADHRPRRARDPFDLFDDVFRNDPFFAEAYKSMDDLFSRRFDASGQLRAGAEDEGGVAEGGSGGGIWGMVSGKIWGMVRDYLPNVKVDVRTSVDTGGYSSTTARSYGPSAVTRMSTRTIVRNGRRVTVQSLEKDGNKIEERYVGGRLVERRVHGVREDIAEIVGGAGGEEF